MLVLIVGLILRLIHLGRLAFRRHSYPYRRIEPGKRIPFRTQPKPAWVGKEVIRIKALMSHAGTCRVIADIFNRRFAAQRKMTVGKTFVAEIIRKHRYDILLAGRAIKRAKPRPMPRNLIWGVDLTGNTTLDGKVRFILGVLEHASRTALWLEALQNKSSWTLILKLTQAIQRYGKPQAVRTDNESVFVSRVFRLALFLLGIRHQRIDLHCPWQNGRVERFFGTLKGKLDQILVESLPALNTAFGEFRFFYNHVRPHQNLNGLTPAEAWAGLDPYATTIKREYWFEAWDGLFKGYYLRR